MISIGPAHTAHGGLPGLLGVGIVPGNDTGIWLGASLSHLFPFSQLDLTLAEKKSVGHETTLS